ncbi:TPA: recombinase RecA [candidate division WOR-3]|uniref:Protein RecA n=2 Tax=Bacteria candidate phyla TaxID=1783234 RepID=A0A348MKB8_UNCW3|nr:recombinase RecA [candidate division WOR-3 bacterium]HCP17563.1 recombinase RecA [candidate division WOR-3 bacterium]
MDMDSNKMKSLEMTLKQIEKDFGKGSIMRLGDRAMVAGDIISTGSIAIDAALGVGGIPRGRIVEIYGAESSGKTTLALQVVAQAQKNGGMAAYIDAEHALDPSYATKLGVDIDNLLVSQPDTGEQALEITEKLVSSGSIDVVVIDSVAALVPKAEIEGDMGDSHMGLQARLMSQALRKLTAVINRSKTAVIFINQVRYKIGVMFGNPMTTPGGLALKFHASVRLEVRRISSIKVGDEDVGNNIEVKVVKNKVAPPFKKAYVSIYFGEGISKYGELIDLGTSLNIIEKTGAWFSYGDIKLGQGKENVRQFLKENKKVADEIETKIRKALGMIVEDNKNRESKEK